MTAEPPATGRPADEPDPPARSAISDEELARFVEESAGPARSAAPREPSARARMVTERLRALDEEAARRQGPRRRWGRRPKQPEPWQPEGWRTGPAWQEMQGGRRGQRRWGAVAGVVFVVLLLVVAMDPSRALSWLPGGSGEPAAEASPLPLETAAPSVAPADEAFPDTPTLDNPFAGSPAEGYADGAEGIVPPEAKAVGAMTKEQVAQALDRTREFLIETNLDPDVLRGARPERALALVDPLQTELLKTWNASLEKPSRTNDPLFLATRFDPDEVRPAGDVVRVRGRMTFDEGERGAVAVHADYTFVYPLTRAEKGATEVARTIVRRLLEVEVASPARARVTAGKLWVTEYAQEAANSSCDLFDGYLHPHFTDTVPTGTPPSGEAVDPYDRSRDPRDRDEGCTEVTRT